MINEKAIEPTPNPPYLSVDDGFAISDTVPNHYDWVNLFLRYKREVCSEVIMLVRDRQVIVATRNEKHSRTFKVPDNTTNNLIWLSGVYTELNQQFKQTT